MNKTIKNIFAMLSLLVIALAFVPARSYAATSNLYLSPSTLSETVGSNFTIYVSLNANGNSVNAIEATVTIPGILAITGAGTGGSLCSIWVQQPTVSGSTVSFKCGIPGGTTANGNLISISLKAAAVGSGSADISSSRVLAGPGQDVTGGSSGGSYAVTAAPPSGSAAKSTGPSSPAAPKAPVLSSASHPDQNKWYANADPKLSWPTPAGATEYSYLWDSNPDSVPPATANLANVTSTSFAGQPDGTWYFHIRAHGAAGWGSTGTFRVQIDKTAPTGLTVVTEPKVVADKRPMVSFAAVDAASGIDRYEISLDKEPFKPTASPYTPATISSGPHTFTVRAFDKAGNMVEAATKITIKNIPAPKITSPKNGTTLKLIQKLQITGTADPSTTIELIIDRATVARGIKVSSSGHWSYTYTTVLMPGSHDLAARAVKDGIESQSTSKTTIRIDPSAVSLFGVTFPMFVVITMLILVIAALIFLAAWAFLTAKKKYDKMKERLIKKNRQTEKMVADKLNGMQDDIRQDMQAMYIAGQKTAKDKRRFLEDKIEKKITSTKEIVEKEINEETEELS